MAKKVNGKKIVVYTGAGIITAALTVAAGIQLYDSCIDHTEKICPFVKYMDEVVQFSDGSEMTRGLIHQLVKMKSQYKEKGEDVIVAYIPEYVDETKDVELKPTLKFELLDGTIKYFAPDGVELVEIDGVYYTTRVNTDESEAYEAIVTYYQDGTDNYNGTTKVLRIGK